MTAGNIKAQQWSFRFVNSGIKPSLAVDSEGNPHIAYMLESTVGGFVSHAEMVNDSIVSQEIALGYFYGPLDIAIDASDRPHVVFHNHDLEDQNYYFRNTLGQWVLDGIADSGHDGWDASIAIDQSGIRYFR